MRIRYERVCDYVTDIAMSLISEYFNRAYTYRCGTRKNTSKVDMAPSILIVCGVLLPFIINGE